MHHYLLHNGTLHLTTEALISPGQVGFLNGWGVFSTIRVVSGVLFAYERHYSRMARDAARLRVPFEFDTSELHNLLLSLVEANHAYDATLRIAIIRNRGGLFEANGPLLPADIVAFTTGLNNWGSGAKLVYGPRVRFGASPFAGIKYTSWAENLTMYETAREQGYDEVILLNEQGEVSECTSANLFAVRGDQVWTPPLGTSGCLPGVTRNLLLTEVKVPGLAVIEREISPAELEESDGVFMTSSTRDLLPVAQIGERSLAQSFQHFEALRAAFLVYRSDYVHAHGRQTIPV